MIFIRARPYPADRGKYEPMSTKIISSGGLAKAAGGDRRHRQKYGIAPGDRWRTPCLTVGESCPPPCWAL